MLEVKVKKGDGSKNIYQIGKVSRQKLEYNTGIGNFEGANGRDFN